MNSIILENQTGSSTNSDLRHFSNILRIYKHWVLVSTNSISVQETNMPFDLLVRYPRQGPLEQLNPQVANVLQNATAAVVYS